MQSLSAELLQRLLTWGNGRLRRKENDSQNISEIKKTHHRSKGVEVLVVWNQRDMKCNSSFNVLHTI